MINQYETTIIITPVLSEDQIKGTVEKFESYLKEHKAEVIHQDHWGLKKLAYPIQKKSTGFYHLFEFKAEGEIIDKLELELIRDERIIRFLTVKLDKHAVGYNERKRLKQKEKKETQKTEE